MNKSVKHKTTPAIRFIWSIGILTTLAVLLLVGYNAFAPQLMRWSLVPTIAFAASPVVARPDYSKPASWVAIPGMAHDEFGPNPSLAVPKNYLSAPHPAIDVFFIPPTTYFLKSHWNAPLDQHEPNRLLNQVARHFTSVFNGVGQIWMPRYRQATFGAFLIDKPERQKALDLAYGDVLAAFDAFQISRSQGGPSRPFILAGHSQGSVHALQLLKDRIVGTPLQAQMIAAYIVGWPVSIEADLAPLGFSVCQSPQSTGCIISWQSFGEPANTDSIRQWFDGTTGLGGTTRRGTHMACVNPLGFWANLDAQPPAANIGALAFAKTGEPMPGLIPALTGAQCKADGFLHIAPNPDAPFNERMLPGANYHSYDYVLFWANIRANAEARVSAFFSPR